MAEYAEYLPMLVLTRVFGLAEGEGRQLAESCAQVIKGGAGRPRRTTTASCRSSVNSPSASGSEPGSDFTTGLLEHHADLDDDEILNHLRLVLITAHTTTSNLLARVLQLVLTDANRLSGLVSGQLNISAVVEEVMWNTPPLAVLPGRFAAGRPRTGRASHPGGRPARPRPGRRATSTRRSGPTSGISVHGNQSHLAFSGGPHECPGQNIGQAIIETAVDVLLHRLPGLRLAVTPDELTSTASTWEARLDSFRSSSRRRRSAGWQWGAAVVCRLPVGRGLSRSSPRPFRGAGFCCSDCQ